jgi:hypothetical protein
VAAHQFVVAPRGNGWDTHRLWEALYLGCVPIVESGPLDSLYAQLGTVLIVKDWATVTEASLKAHYASLEASGALKQSSLLLHRPYWRSVIEATRTRALHDLSPKSAAVGNASRTRCWG